MENGRRSGEPSGYVVKSKGPSGCLIVRKKGSDGVGAAGSSVSRKLFESKKEKKRPRLDFSDSGSSDELLMRSQRSLAPKTSRIRNGVAVYDAGVKEESGIARKRGRGEGGRRSETDAIVRDRDNLIDRTRTRLDVFDFDEYECSEAGSIRRKRAEEGGIDSRRFYGSMTVGRGSIEREYDSGSSRDALPANRQDSCFERASGLTRGDPSSRGGVRLPRDEYESDKPIRVQGKNGVLKVMVNKKKKVGGSLNGYNAMEPEEVRKGVRIEEFSKKNALLHPSYYSESKKLEKAIPLVGREKKPMNYSLKSEDDNVSDQDSEDSGILLTNKANMRAKYAEPSSSQKVPISVKKSVGTGVNSDESDTSLKLGPQNGGGSGSRTRTSGGDEKTTPSKLLQNRINEGKAKRGSGTEKQKLRERIRGMLVDAGWTIDYRPRRNRDYLDAVYINPAGTAYWSIIKAYDALLKQLNEDEELVKAKVECSQITPLPDELLSQLTRNTRKKMEKEMRKKQRGSRQNENANEAVGRKASTSRCDEESMDSHSQEEKLSSFIKQSGKSFKSKLYCNSSTSETSKDHRSMHTLDSNDEKLSSVYNSHHGRTSRKLGRCTLLVRKSNQGLTSDGDGFVPYTGKRTLLSWLVDSGAVQLSQKVRYMNRRRTKILLEGWVTRDGIHCGCCSKILTVSKFEIHAGSKLRQPFQNIYLDSGVSLLDCQIDAWNRLEAAENIGFHTVDVDGDDPNDDTCGLCGDGGDLICCDSCPSTFHQSCLDIEMLPPGDWHCPNCTCKFCGSAGENLVDEDDPTVLALPTCSLCARKYHESCIKDMDAATVEGDSSKSCFCSKKCRELFEQLLKYLGVKYELEAGFSWSLIRRTDFDLDASLQGHPQRVEGNSKLAVALSVMDECFLPTIDRRSGINLIHGVIYNCGSNFNRLNYSGFFTLILERGDEIISAASIRLHGTELAEMPFIGTRHIYRRQGMCRRLFCAVELVLRALKVEKLIIPAIPELMRTWTEVFGFTSLDESLEQELKSMNTMVFPGVDMLQKRLLQLDNVEKRNTDKGAKEKGPQGDKRMTNGSAGDGLHESDSGGLEHNNNSKMKVGELARAKCDTSGPYASANSTKSSLDASHEIKLSAGSDSGLAGKKFDKSRISNVKSASGENDDISSHAHPDNQLLLPISSDNVSGMSGSPDGGHKQSINGEAFKRVDESASVATHLGMSNIVSSLREEVKEAAHDFEENRPDEAEAFNLLSASTSEEEEYKGLFSTEQTEWPDDFRKDSEPTDVDAPREEYQVRSGLEATKHGVASCEHGSDTDASEGKTESE